MSLADFLNLCEVQTTHVLISKNGEWPHEEYHSIPACVLPILRRIWMENYDQWQRTQASHVKQAQTNLAKVARAGKRM